MSGVPEPPKGWFRDALSGLAGFLALWAYEGHGWLRGHEAHEDHGANPAYTGLSNGFKPSA